MINVWHSSQDGHICYCHMSHHTEKIIKDSRIDNII